MFDIMDISINSAPAKHGQRCCCRSIDCSLPENGTGNKSQVGDTVGYKNQR